MPLTSIGYEWRGITLVDGNEILYKKKNIIYLITILSGLIASSSSKIYLILQIIIIAVYANSHIDHRVWRWVIVPFGFGVNSSFGPKQPIS